ncbi:hypothetical protein U0070_020808 [Myodes glareolus]|uniref:C-type lectin domain-containing protein n=1 Tax=Myodes glareolus TaxID=447135 RepID=A0AAW0GXN2_MYOGA
MTEPTGTEQKYIHVFFLTLGRTAILTCLKDWHPYKDKCLFISQTSGSWAQGQDDCYSREATLLLIDNKEELKFIQDFSSRNKMDFFIGLNYVPAEKIWKWINGSILNTDV